ncbi:hypothetical protein T484DRAFT_1618980, partial [Baffinella frigidus]
TLHPTPYTLHPTPYTLHPTPYTLHPTPYTLHPNPSALTRGMDGPAVRAPPSPRSICKTMPLTHMACGHCCASLAQYAKLCHSRTHHTNMRYATGVQPR